MEKPLSDSCRYAVTRTLTKFQHSFAYSSFARLSLKVSLIAISNANFACPDHCNFEICRVNYNREKRALVQYTLTTYRA